MLARGAMGDDVSALQRTITAEVLAGGEGPAAADLIGVWQARNARALARVEQMLTELRAAPATDAAMLSVALRELRTLA
jgi:glutamate dehydrogenase